MKNTLRIVKLIPAAVCLFIGASAVAQAQEASTQYKPSSRDVFVKPKPAPPRKEAPKPEAPKPIAAPDIQARIERYKALKLEAMNRQSPAPKPTTALLLDEVEVMGVFRTPRGYAAMVEAKPIKLSYVIYPGEMFYDGQLVAIEDGRLLFRRERRWTNGRRDLLPEYKALRKPDNSDDLALTKTSAEKESSDASKKAASKDEKKETEAGGKAVVVGAAKTQ